MEFTAAQIAELIQGVVVGNPEEKINNVSKIEEGKPGTISFLANPKYERYLYSTASSVVIVNNSFEPSQKISSTLIKVPDAYVAIASLLNMYEQSQPTKSGIESPSFIDTSSKYGDFVYIGAFAYIGENVTIGNNVKIYPQVYIGDGVSIGDNTIIYAGVKIYKGCKIGCECIIHAGAVIGSDGFGFAPDETNNFKKIAQIGNVVVEDQVEIGANTTIDRATMGSTRIKKGAKIDNLIQLAHNVEVGNNTVIAAQTGIAGSSKIGNYCMIGGQVGIAGHLTIADNVKMAAQTGVSKNITQKGSVLMGSPAFEAMSFNKAYTIFRKLPDIYQQINRIEKELKK
ncbi:MAG: UDP-3-O-(3-hydroxymyristoyl)glucosamine N-acyltransferase [Marinilabiliaceae bacterium]|nr:UDP-3-O-(3-hydroxymyristoyl)glucosamine N-acyltransferase [Marinilabiliaceae bacterium]